MQEYSRVAVYYAPEAESPLAEFGGSWLGWDTGKACEVAHPDIALDVATITQRPRKYGFHGTLKPPFRLAKGQTRDAFVAGAEALAASRAPIELDGLALSQLGRFIALTPTGDVGPLADLAAATVRELDPFRAPLNEAEMTKRRASGLSARQEVLLAEWGYPFVLDEFRFHLTLSGPLDEPSPVFTALEPLVAPVLPRPFCINELCLFGERADGRFEIFHRIPLSG